MKRNLFVRIFFLFKPLWGVVSVFTLLFIASSSAAAVWPYYLGLIIDHISKNTITEQTYTYIWIISGVFLLTTVLSMCRGIFETRFIDRRADMLLSEISLQKMMNLSVGQHIRSDSSFKQSALSKGEDALSEIFFQMTSGILSSLVRYITMVAFTFVFSPVIASIMLGITLLQLLLMHQTNMHFLPRWRALRDATLEVSRWNSEMLRVITRVLLGGIGTHIEREQHVRNEKILDHHRKTWVPYEYRVSLIAVLADLNLIAVVVYGVFAVGVWQTLSAGIVVAIFNYAVRMNGTIDQLHQALRRIAQNLPNAEKYFHMLDLESDVPESKQPVPIVCVGDGAEIVFDGVTFKHTNASDEISEKEEESGSAITALDAVSFDIAPGEVCALVGRSGSGKTTTVHLLLRAFDPDTGVVRVCGADIKAYRSQEYRRMIGYVEQEVTLVNDTLRNNILFGLSDAEKQQWTDDALIALAKTARIDQFFDRLGSTPFETVIGERGVKLSGGQRQRVGIARALATGPRVLIFDEATSSLDGENERAIHEAMKDSFKGRTVLIIAHRLATVRNADKIICLDKGVIAGIGTHKTLYATCLPYKELVDAQME